ncbi:hypothetical protein TgHK011_003304 [Trichoderma gracile]|nr:hypothetical protein TgHK011_003304 [Trichoderma gracile]
MFAGAADAARKPFSCLLLVFSSASNISPWLVVANGAACEELGSPPLALSSFVPPFDDVHDKGSDFRLLLELPLLLYSIKKSSHRRFRRSEQRESAETRVRIKQRPKIVLCKGGDYSGTTRFCCGGSGGDNWRGSPVASRQLYINMDLSTQLMPIFHRLQNPAILTQRKTPQTDDSSPGS